MTTYQYMLIIAIIAALTAGTFITPIFQTILYNIGKRFNIEYEREDRRFILLVPVKREPVEVLLNFFRRNSRIISKSLATFLICDEYDIETINSFIKELSSEKLTENLILFLSRGSKNKAEALNKALRSLVLKRDFRIVVLDIDSIADIPPESFYVVSPRWRGFSVMRSLLGRGQEIGYTLFMRILDGMYIVARWRPTLGSGLIISSRALQEVGLFNDNVILEDVEYSVRTIHKKLPISTFSNYVVSVQVPSTYNALLRQQVRWAYGAGELLRKYSKLLIKKPLISLYLIQYLSYPFQLILAIILYFCSIFHIYIPVPLQVIILALIIYTSSTYVIWCFQDILKGFSMKDIKEPLLSLNRVNMAYAVMSPRVLASFLSGLIGLPFRWIPTPKIEKLPPLSDRLKMYVVEIVLSFILIVLSLLALLYGNIFQLYMIDPVAFTITYVWGTFRVVERELT